ARQRTDACRNRCYRGELHRTRYSALLRVAGFRGQHAQTITHCRRTQGAAQAARKRRENRVAHVDPQRASKAPARKTPTLTSIRIESIFAFGESFMFKQN